MKNGKETKLIDPKDIRGWRKWLEKNHLKEKKVGIIVHKKHTGKPSLTHKETMGEAICFGWIDTTLRRLDEDRYIRFFARRTDNSRWSNNTLKYAKELIKQGKMAPEGLKRYKEGVKKEVIDFVMENDHEAPEDLKKELAKHKGAAENFNNFAKSYKRTYIRWICRAKRSETREKRIKEVVKRAIENRKLFLS